MARTASHQHGWRLRVDVIWALVLLTSSLFHSHLHGCDPAGSCSGPSGQRHFVKRATEGNNSTANRILPCLVCNCQKQKVAVLSAQAVLAELTDIGHCFISPILSFKRQQALPANSSRAPPLLSQA